MLLIRGSRDVVNKSREINQEIEVYRNRRCMGINIRNQRRC